MRRIGGVFIEKKLQIAVAIFEIIASENDFM
jgi:hypothetical protein